jgi:hypothetical protein
LQLATWKHLLQLKQIKHLERILLQHMWKTYATSRSKRSHNVWHNLSLFVYVAYKCSLNFFLHRNYLYKLTLRRIILSEGVLKLWKL